MSDEEPSKIEETFISKLGAKYPFVQAKGVNEQYGIKFFPSVYAIDAAGNVHSVPDDRMPSESTIEELLKAVSLAPKMPDGAPYDGLRNLWKKKQYLALQEQLAKLLLSPNLDAATSEELRNQQAVLEKKCSAQEQRALGLEKGPDYYAAKTQLESIVKDWKGLPPATAASGVLERFAADAAVKKELAASKALATLRSKFDPSKAAQARKLQEELHKFAKKYVDTYAGQQVQKQISGGK